MNRFWLSKLLLAVAAFIISLVFINYFSSFGLGAIFIIPILFAGLVSSAIYAIYTALKINQLRRQKGAGEQQVKGKGPEKFLIVAFIIFGVLAVLWVGWAVHSMFTLDKRLGEEGCEEKGAVGVKVSEAEFELCIYDDGRSYSRAIEGCEQDGGWIDEFSGSRYVCVLNDGTECEIGSTFDGECEY